MAQVLPQKIPCPPAVLGTGNREKPFYLGSGWRPLRWVACLNSGSVHYAVCPWESHSTSLCLCFLICKVSQYWCSGIKYEKYFWNIAQCRIEVQSISALHFPCFFLCPLFRLSELWAIMPSEQRQAWPMPHGLTWELMGWHGLSSQGPEVSRMSHAWGGENTQMLGVRSRAQTQAGGWHPSLSPCPRAIWVSPCSLFWMGTHAHLSKNQLGKYNSFDIKQRKTKFQIIHSSSVG